MIFYVVTSRFSSTIRRLIRGLGRETNGLISFVTYEELFFERAAYLGHYIFTDFDRLSRYETDYAAAVAIALQKAAPELKILNHPLEVCERFRLLVRLYRAGLNEFPVHRLDSGQRPTAYPAFIRAEDGYGGPESGIIEDERQFESALVDISRRGLPLKGRIAVGYVGERDIEGFHRKYGAFNIGGAIIPQHLMCGDDWVVKKNSSRIGTKSIEEELSYVRDNPHAEHLSLAFRIGGIQFGRVDYGLYCGLTGRLQRLRSSFGSCKPTRAGAVRNVVR
jgi:hypothetical protein